MITTSWLQQGLAESHLDVSMDRISHLELLPPTTEFVTKTTTPAKILAVRLHIPTVDSHFNIEYESIIDIWDVLTDQPQPLHPAFEQRGSKGGTAANPSPLMVLQKRDSIVIDKVILSIETSLHGKIICLGFSDGTVQYRERSTMAEILPEEQTSKITILQQAGFHFAEEKPSLQTSFSPNLCAFAQICENGQISWNSLQYPAEQIGSFRPDPFYEAALAGLTMATANATHQNTNHDDILAAARPIAEKHPGFLSEWVKTLVLMLNIHVDYSEDVPQDHLIRNLQWLHAMSILNHFGFTGWFKPRSFSGKFTMLGLSLRNIVILMTVANNSPMLGAMRERITPLDEPGEFDPRCQCLLPVGTKLTSHAEVVNVLSGCAQWSVALMSWLTDSLFTLRDDAKFKDILSSPSNFSEMTNFLKERNEVALHLILSSSTRSLLIAVCKRIIHLQTVCHRAQEYYWHTSERQGATPAHRTLQRAYTKLQQATTTNLVKINEFEALLAAVCEGVRTTYQVSFAGLQRGAQQPPPKPGQPSPGTFKKATAQCELLIFLGEQPPPRFQQFVHKFFEADLERIMGATKRFQLFFTAFPLLEVEDDPKRLAARRTDAKFVDVFKRVEFSAPRLVRGGNLLAATNGGGVVDMVKQERGLDHGMQQQQQNEEPAGPIFRRCVRCCGVMEDVASTNLRPGFNFVFQQQRKCSCGGSWAF